MNRLALIIALFSCVASCSGETGNTIIDTPGGKEPETPVAPPAHGNGTEAGSKVLVAYFSFTGNTKAVAESIASACGADIYEIVPEQAYAADNSNYYDESTRAYQEQYGPATARPAIKKTFKDADSYDVVFLGSPIWYGKAPRLMLSFLDAYGFSGKTVIPFVTSASSGISSAQSEYESTYPDINWKKGDRLNGKTAEDIKSWVSSLGITSSSESTSSMKIQISTGGRTINATLADNSSGKAFADKLKEGPVTIEMHDYGGFEKVGPLGFSIVQNNEQITTVPGDIILYQGSNICLYYDTNEWNFTRLGKMENVSQSEIKSILKAGEGNINVTFSLTE